MVGSTPELAAAPQTGVGDRLNGPWCMVVRSCWHGPNHEGRWGAHASDIWIPRSVASSPSLDGALLAAGLSCCVPHEALRASTLPA